jgi:hypothetical protein
MLCTLKKGGSGGSNLRSNTIKKCLRKDLIWGALLIVFELKNDPRDPPLGGGMDPPTGGSRGQIHSKFRGFECV